MEDLISLIIRIYKTPQAFMRRFALLSLALIAYVIYQAFNLEGWLPTEWHNAINLSVLTLVVFLGIRAFVLFPNERHWILRIQSAIDYMCWPYAEYELEHPPTLLTCSTKFLSRVMQARLLLVRAE